ncbi:PAS domain-containing protein [Myxococcaceae bacterium GXIMD 01537]
MPGEELDILMEALADALVVCDGAERITFINRAAERMLGWSADTLRGKPFSELLPERLRSLEGESFLRYLLNHHGFLGGRPVRAAVSRRDGVELLVEVTLGTSGEGERERRVLSLHRMPELVEPADTPAALLRLAEIVQRPSDQEPHPGDRLYRTVVENAPLGIFHFDRTPVITTCNDYFVRLIGSTKRVLIGLSLTSLRDTSILGCVKAALQGRRTLYEGDYHSQTGDKVTPVRVHFAPCYSQDGLVVSGGVGIVEDITEHRLADEERARHLAQLDVLYRTAPIGLGFLDTHLRYVRVNDVLARMNGVSAEEHVGRHPREVLGPVPGAKVEALLRVPLETGEPQEGLELRSSDIDPRMPPIVWAASFYPVRTPEGRLLGVGVLLEDITARKDAEEERARLLHEAREAIRVRDDFLSIASHELKTPLTPLSLRLAHLERRLERGESVDPGVLHQARMHLLRLTALINDLLDASRIEAGRLALHPEPTRLDGLVEHVIHGMKDVRDGRDIRFHHPAEAVQVRCDPFRLEQVIANLLENALKYSPAGGTVHVELQVRGDVAVLSVRDEGIGIPPDEQKLLFERFFRARNASSRSFGGLGLGLYISRDIVERHGGRIWVESEVDHGSTFFVALPLLASRSAAAPEPRQGHAP